MSNPKHLSTTGGYRNTMAYYQPQHAVAVVRDWHPLKRSLASGAMSVMLVSALAVPNVAFAAESIQFDGDDDATTDAIDTETFQWDGAGNDDMTMSNYDGVGFMIEGDANINVEGDNTVAGSIHVYNGDLTISGDENAYGENKPSITLTNDADKGWNSITASGNMEIDDVNITFDNEGYEDDRYYGSISAYGSGDKDGDLKIKDSKIAASSVMGEDAIDEDGHATNSVSVYAAGKMGIEGSVLDVNRVCSYDDMTIDNSDITATRNYELEDDEPFLGVYSIDGHIKLVGEQNGTVETWRDEYGHEFEYVSTDSDDVVELKAAEAPAYYGPSTQGMPATGDTENAGLMAGAAAAAAASLAAVGASLGFRKRGKHEA